MSKLDPFKLLAMADDLRRIAEREGSANVFRFARDLESRADMLLAEEGFPKHTGIITEEKDNDD